MRDVDLSLLIPTIVGGLLALCGGVLGQWFSDRRTAKREQRAWDREDRNRTFDDRRKACVDFYSLAAATSTALRTANKWPGVLEVPPDWEFRLSTLLGVLDLVTGRTSLLAGELIFALGRLAQHQAEAQSSPIPDGNEGDARRQALLAASEDCTRRQVYLQNSIREDLGVLPFPAQQPAERVSDA